MPQLNATLYGQPELSTRQQLQRLLEVGQPISQALIPTFAPPNTTERIGYESEEDEYGAFSRTWITRRGDAKQGWDIRETDAGINDGATPYSSSAVATAYGLPDGVAVSLMGSFPAASYARPATVRITVTCAEEQAERAQAILAALETQYPLAHVQLPVRIVAYNPRYVFRFDTEKSALLAVFNMRGTGIEHIGSTAVEGMQGTATIDIAVGVPPRAESMDFSEPLKRIGYAPYPYEGPTYRKVVEPHDKEYHLFVVPLGGQEWQNLLCFRDILQSHSDVAHRYEALKQQLARQYRRNPAYYEGKKSFVEQVLQETQKEND